MTIAEHNGAPGKPGLVLHRAAAYDLMVWFLTLGRERAFRDKIAALACLAPGERVLDIGCGTGSLALAAKRSVGAAGAVCGIDASPEMIARARKKAAKAGIEIAFQEGAAQALPFAAAQFDAVLSTVMLHHLSRSARKDCAEEMRRVLKPGGRALAVDFAATPRAQHGPLAHLHHRHGHVSLEEIGTTLSAAGLNTIASGAVGFRDLNYVLAQAP